MEALVAPHQETIDSVNQWLFSHGLKESELVRSPAKDWVTVKIPVSLAEKMLDAVGPDLISLMEVMLTSRTLADILRLETP